MRHTIAALGTLIIGVALAAGTARAAPENVTLTLTGTITVDPPCVINGNRDITVAFDTLLNTAIDGVAAAETLGPVFDCAGALNPNLTYTLTGNAVSWNSGQALETSRDNLGLQFYQGSAGGTKIPLNTPVNFISTAPPVIWVAPVKNTTLPAGGTYYANATLTVDYQ